eukprot:gb/GFBE01008602.1/.p1 GENE.gb/GFBE01008602.1/~~gb/GFBE01008602.1/.p1  ORF type:complete len:189 (+),score=11.79 gb/GFBE01008602.1/:1-567(+)
MLHGILASGNLITCEKRFHQCIPEDFRKMCACQRVFRLFTCSQLGIGRPDAAAASCSPGPSCDRSGTRQEKVASTTDGRRPLALETAAVSMSSAVLETFTLLRMLLTLFGVITFPTFARLGRLLLSSRQLPRAVPAAVASCPKGLWASSALVVPVAARTAWTIRPGELGLLSPTGWPIGGLGACGACA